MSYDDIMKIMGVRGSIFPSSNVDFRVVKNITKEYPKMIKVVVYREPKIFIETKRFGKKKQKSSDEKYEPSISSLKRTKTLVRDIVL